MNFFLALDGTADVTQKTRVERAALIGQFCLVMLMPPGKDPDEVTTADLVQAKGDARPVLTEWLELLEALDGQEKQDSRKRLFEYLKTWAADDPSGAGERRKTVCEALLLNDQEYQAAIEGAVLRPETEKGRRGEGANTSQPTAGRRDAGATRSIRFPNQPVALGKPPSGEVERAEIANFYKEYRLVPDEDEVEKINGDPEKIKLLAELKELDQERLKYKRAIAAFMKAKEAGATVGEPPDEMSEEKAERLQQLRAHWKAKEKQSNVAMNMDAMRNLVRKVMRGWPMRLVSGSLFVDDDRADVSWDSVPQDQDNQTRKKNGQTSISFQFGPPVLMVNDGQKFLSMLHDYGRVKFNRGQDVDKFNYVGTETLFTNFCASVDIPLWLEIERYPHEPALPGHYYAWKEPEDDYKPTGEKLAELIGFFDNIREPHHRALFAASIVTPFWGGAYGSRPFMFFWANGQGSGKSTAAEMICNLVGGYAALDFSNRGEERLKERILSDDFSGTRCLLGDNLTGRIESPLLAELATASRISGKKLSVGEAWRPNSLCVFLTGNNPQLDKDLTVRTFFVKFEPIEEVGKDIGQRVDWKEKLRAFIAENSKRIMADCLFVLGAKRKPVDWTGITSERNADWVSEVLAAVMENEHIKKRIGQTIIQDVLVRNQAYRESVDEELDEALRFMQALVERVCEWYGYALAGEDGALASRWPYEPVFIRASSKGKTDGEEDKSEAGQNITSVWRSVVRGDVNPTWVGRRVNTHIEQGRLKGLKGYRSTTRRGYMLDPETIVLFLAERAGKDPHTVVVEWRAARDANAPTAPETMTP